MPEVYTDLIRLQSLGNDLQLEIISGKTEQIVSSEEPLFLEKEYQFRIGLKEDAYVYAFYYESDDLLGLHMFMLYPLSKNENNLCKAGLLNLPRIGNQEFTFVPSPPVSGQVVIKLVATSKKLALDFTETADGFLYLTEDQCSIFLKQLKNMNSEQLQTAVLVKDIER